MMKIGLMLNFCELSLERLLRGGAFRILQRRKTIRTSNQPGEKRGFGKIQFRCALAKICLRSCFNSVAASTEIDAINVKLQNLLLAELTLDTQSYQRFQ